MIKILKKLLFLVFLSPAVLQVSFFRYLGTRAVQVATAATVTCAGVQALKVNAVDKQRSRLPTVAAFNMKNAGKLYKNVRDLHYVDPQLHALCKQMQLDLGLDEVDIKFYVADDLLFLISVIPNSIVNSSSFVMLFNKKAVKVESEELIKILLRHEFEHIKQGRQGYPEIYLQIICLMRYCSVSKWIDIQKKKSQLMEQAADAAACGDCQCFKCLENFAFHRRGVNSAKVNSEGNYVSDHGYLSPSEIMQYAAATKQDIGFNGLCEKHRNEYFEQRAKRRSITKKLWC